MSHKATNWAITQRGLKPATKIVLWHLADCHNPSQGCFPSQDYLAQACEMSRASINTHLNILEEAGLIRRETGVDERTKRQRPTRYFLAFEDEEEGEPPVSKSWTRPVSRNQTRAVSRKRAEPCPENGKSRVQNLDTNPVKEPVSLTAARDDEGEASCRRAVALFLRGGRSGVPVHWLTEARLDAMLAEKMITETERAAGLDLTSPAPEGAPPGGERVLPDADRIRVGRAHDFTTLKALQ